MKTTEYIVNTINRYDWGLLAQSLSTYDTCEKANDYLRKLVASLQVVEVVTTRTWVVQHDGWTITHDQKPDSIPEDATITEHVHTARQVVSSMACKPQQEQPE